MKRRINIAASLRVGTCDSCDAIHIIFLDDEGNPISTGMVTPENWQRMVEMVAREQALKQVDTIGQVAGHG